MRETVPKRCHTREESGIRLDVDGHWWHDGERIEHPKILAAFDAGLQPEEDGRFKLTFGHDWCFVEVEGAAYRVVEAWQEGEQIRLALSDGSQEWLDPPTLTSDSAGVLVCRVKSGRAQARFSRTVQFQVGSWLETDGGKVVLQLKEQRFATGIDRQALEQGAEGE